ncbi:hypothetical protein KJ969_01095 [Patescibacteria group bacterium]|nr:hypothetical protein [Patescibacteria group bacterium]MBU1922083.1 hypothetical protein [Patescibacteria group bacterium]
MPKQKISKPGPSTQRFLDIAEIKEDTVVLKDGTLRAVVVVSSINFSLKSSDEQAAIISAYMQLLNSLDYSLQIVIQSRKMNIEKYLNVLQEEQKKQTNELLRAQIADYRGFISELVSLGDIMSKRFFAVIPYDPLTNKRKGFFARLKEIISPVVSLKLKDERFQSRRKELFMRVNHLTTALQGIGLTAIVLDTQSLIELYYSVYNPEVYESQKVKDLSKIQIEE